MDKRSEKAEEWKNIFSEPVHLLGDDIYMKAHGFVKIFGKEVIIIIIATRIRFNKRITNGNAICQTSGYLNIQYRGFDI